VITLDRIEDERGFFARHYCEREFSTHGLMSKVAQVSTSFNRFRGTLRGLHYQVAPRSETKLVRCIRGAVHDVILDLRKSSPTFGQSYGEELNERNGRLMYVPKGFAHGFLTLENDSELVYTMDEFYAPEYERGIRWNDNRFAIDWPVEPTFVSPKDRSHRDFDPDWHLAD
jgi:dTDP-4-dehydrorhamnose 3,5-epimerase